MIKTLYRLLVIGVVAGVLTGCSNSDSKEQDSMALEESIIETQSEENINGGKEESESINVSSDLLTEQYGNMVTTIQTESSEILLYYPVPNTAETLGVITICTSPTILVFGDGDYEEEEAVAFANESGLAKLAAENGASVCFVNPIDETWSDKDKDAYVHAAASILSTTRDPVENGVVLRVDAQTGETIPSIAGNQSRIYVYGIGSGADYVAKNVLKTSFAKMFFGYDVDVTPSACSLEKCTQTVEISSNDIPIISIGNSDAVNQILEEKCGSVTKYEDRAYETQYKDKMMHYRRQCGRLVNIYDWNAEGIVESVETCAVKTSPDNASELYKDTETHPINYVVYYSEDLDVVNGKIPLVLIFHGGGNSALHEAMMTDWPIIGKENGFITCSVDSHYPNCTATEIIELIDILKSKYSIDESRIYASGFSMGGVKCWDLYEQYPEVFAGLAPMDASNVVGLDTYDNPVEDINKDTVVPLFYVGGEASPLEELPFQSEKVMNRMYQVFDVNQIAASYEAEFDDVQNWGNKVWGINGDLSYSVTDSIFTDSVLNVQLFKSKDGYYYTALASASNQAHEIYARNSWAAWDFLSQFSRNGDGTIDINKNISYALPSDDNSIIDNTYNR